MIESGGQWQFSTGKRRNLGRLAARRRHKHCFASLDAGRIVASQAIRCGKSAGKLLPGAGYLLDN